MNDNTTTIRRSVPTKGLSSWWEVGWMYVMPDFDRPDHSIIEWVNGNAPVEPNRVPASQAENDHATWR